MVHFFTEDPFLYPSMTCTVCGCNFEFAHPFQDANRAECPRCKQVTNIPEAALKELKSNVSFMEHIANRRPEETPPAPEQPQA